MRRVLIVYLVLLVPIAWLAAKFSAYEIDGDAVSYMDIADLLRTHQWGGAVNAYWHPLYPAGLALAQVLLHPTRATELGAYYALNYGIFLLQVLAMLAFTSALVKLRERMQGASGTPLLSLNMLRLLGLGLLVVASQRELGMGKVRPDALLQALMLGAFAMLLQALATESLLFAPVMGLLFGAAYLTKSFAFLVALLSVVLMMVFQYVVQRRGVVKILAAGVLASVAFAVVAGPYIGALSRQKHRFDFGDSGALNAAWYSGGTQKMHLEPWQTERFGSADVKLIHPEKQLLAEPGIYSYKALPYGTYPAWFDTTYFNDRVVPHVNLPALLKRDGRNAVLVLRYLLNHPEAWVLLLLLLVAGGRLRFGNWRRNGFWLPMMLLGLAMWALYGLVNIEERYVTLAYLVVVLPVFAVLSCRDKGRESEGFASAMVVAFAFLMLGGSLRTALEARRLDSGAGLPAAWYSPQIFGAAEGLAHLGVKPGDEIACLGTIACLNDYYWARLAGVRVLTEVWNTDPKNLLAELEGLPNRDAVYGVVKAEGAKVIVAKFEPGVMTGTTPASKGWVRLGETNYYALPLNLTVPVTGPAGDAGVRPLAWTATDTGP